MNVALLASVLSLQAAAHPAVLVDTGMRADAVFVSSPDSFAGMLHREGKPDVLQFFDGSMRPGRRYEIPSRDAVIAIGLDGRPVLEEIRERYLTVDGSRVVSLGAPIPSEETFRSGGALVQEYLNRLFVLTPVDPLGTIGEVRAKDLYAVDHSLSALAVIRRTRAASDLSVYRLPGGRRSGKPITVRTNAGRAAALFVPGERSMAFLDRGHVLCMAETASFSAVERRAAPVLSWGGATRPDGSDRLEMGLCLVDARTGRAKLVARFEDAIGPLAEPGLEYWHVDRCHIVPLASANACALVVWNQLVIVRNLPAPRSAARVAHLSRGSVRIGDCLGLLEWKEHQ